MMEHNNLEVIKWLEKLLHERFNLELRLRYLREKYIITIKDLDSCIIFDNLNKNFFQSSDELKYNEWDAVEQGWNVLIGQKLPMPGGDIKNNLIIEICNENYLIHYDILGLAFWMLTRIEEINYKNLDEHNRFQGKRSHAHRHGYLSRPIVDEWFDILSQVIKRVWPNIIIKTPKPAIIVTCDVDNPFAYDIKFKSLPRSIAKNLVRQKSITNAFNTCKNFFLGSSKIYTEDPYINNINWIMDVNEKVGHQVIFYFLAGGSHKFDGTYTLKDSRIKALMRDIITRGHKIGLHPSYESYRNPMILGSEVIALRNALSDLGSGETNLESRQHFLRWHPIETPNFLQNTGVFCDSSLGYADLPGFRCGTAHEYQMFDAKRRSLINLRQRPLIVMESSLIEHRYMGLGYSEATLDHILEYRSNAIKCGGQFVMLWHNSSFEELNSYEIYKKIINFI